MTGEERGWLTLSLMPGTGPRTLERIVQLYGGAEAAASAPPGELAGIIGARAAPADPGAAERVLAACEQRGIRILTRGSEGYPELLGEIYDPPSVLYILGEADLRQPRALAIVGSRKSTPYGRDAALTLAQAAAEAGVCVVSGMARGIDTFAHEGALRGGFAPSGGVTVAVLGCGVDVPYPTENTALRDRIAASGGAVISEHPPGTPPLAPHFPVRNRIISGLSHGVLVVEGGATSGTMITVGYAAEQGREVLAVPGNIFSPTSVHPNRLIRDGAHLVAEARDIFDALAWASPLRTAADPARMPALDPEEHAVYACLVSGPRPFSLLCGDTGFTASKLNALLTTMELRGIIKQLPGRMIALAGGLPKQP